MVCSSALPAVAEPLSYSDTPQLFPPPTGTAEPSTRFCRAFLLCCPGKSPIALLAALHENDAKKASEEPMTTECAILQPPNSERARRAGNSLHNAPRRPSEATTTRFGPKYRKIRNKGILRPFPPGMRQTSDFLGLKCRGFAHKVRRFMPKKSDVFRRKSGNFNSFRGQFSHFCGKSPVKVP